MGRLAWPAARSLPVIGTPEDATRVAMQLNATARKLMFEQLQSMQSIATAESQETTTGAQSAKVTGAQLYRIFLFNGLPFIGFGILDNGIMIAAGEYIDITIGVTLGISTMAAAALGNLVSDVCGIGMAGYVELFVARFGVTPIELTAEQTLSQGSCSWHIDRLYNWHVSIAFL